MANKKEPAWDKFMRETLQFVIRGKNIPPPVSDLKSVVDLLKPESTKKEPIKQGYVSEIDDVLEEINSAYAPTNEFNLDLDKCIILPGKKHENYRYEDLVVSMHKLGYSRSIENIANHYGFEVHFPSKESNECNYIGGVECGNFLLLNSALGNMTLNLRQLFDLKNLLTEGVFFKKKIYNGKGDQIFQYILKDIYSEIFLKRNPLRGEFIDNAYSSNINGSLIYSSNHRLENGALIPQRIGIVEKYLKEPCFIDSESCTSAGLPIKEGWDLYYIPPVNDSVSCIIANENTVIIDCSVPRKTKDYAIGIRPVRLRG